jgi:hypothetical protein
MGRQSQNLTHWNDLAGRESPAASRGPNRFHGQKNGPTGAAGESLRLFPQLDLDPTCPESEPQVTKVTA